MPAGLTSRNYTCHWDYVDGPSRHGRPVRAMVWICEYPYRTMRLTGPNDDCDDCPIRTQAQAGPEVQQPAAKDTPIDQPIASR